MIYFDNAATTKPSIDAINKASKFNEDYYFNPSALYQGGLESSKEIKSAKENILKCLSLSPSEYQVVFTSCGSESDNTAIFCSVKRGGYLTDEGEHSAVYKSFLELKQRGQSVFFAPINSDGSVNTDEVCRLVKENKIDFVSIVHVNNETGAINDINKIARLVKEINPNIVFHSDGVQAFGKLPYSLSRDIDMYSVSAHKINGLKGVGALIKRKKLNVNPLIFGGGQEDGIRSGTENVFGIKVFEYSCLMHYSKIKEFFDYVLKLKKYVINGLDKTNFTIISGENSSPYILSVSARGLRGEVIMHMLENDGIIVGNGSACSSRNRYSRVITACGYKNDVLDGVIRISFSIDNTIEECDSLIKSLNSAVNRLKGIM